MRISALTSDGALVAEEEEVDDELAEAPFAASQLAGIRLRIRPFCVFERG